MSATFVGYEIWAEYAPTRSRKRQYTKQSRRFGDVLFDSIVEVSMALVGAEQSEAMSRNMAADLGQPHHDATFTVREVRTVHTPIAAADVFIRASREHSPREELDMQASHTNDETEVVA